MIVNGNEYFYNIKFIYLIFTLYLFALPAVPCCAYDSCSDAQTEQPAGHNEEDKDCGNCSPFFSCEGCATATIVYQPFSFEFSTTILLPEYTTYVQTSLPHVDYDFWQPPRLG